MGAVADKWDMSRGFAVPMVCFSLVAFYGFNWTRFSKADSMGGVKIAGGH
jgi:FHS family L-fucose permease-like MFS transporter